MTNDQKIIIQNKLAEIVKKYKNGATLTEAEKGALVKLVYGATHEDFTELLKGVQK